MKIKAKPFKTWEEQIDILNEWGNNFLKNNEQEKSNILKYLKKYNFQVCVDAFSPLLWQKFEDGINEINPNFLDGFVFNDLLELFNFDNELKKIINNKLEELEKRLKTAIIYHTLKSLNEMNKDIINLPFILLDDEWSKNIAIKLFNNKFSKESFFKTNNDGKKEFIFKDYFYFLIDYINPYKKYSYSINNDFSKFFFPKIIKNYENIQEERDKLLNQFNFLVSEDDIISNSNNITKIKDKYIQIENEINNTSIKCNFSNLLSVLKSEKNNKTSTDKNQNLDIDREKSISNAINILAKSFIPLYKSFTQISFGNIIDFFCKLNENIQIEIIKEHFSTFYTSIKKLIKRKNKPNLIIISTFISFLNTFKNLRNKVAHHDVVYNFWDIYVPINSKSTWLLPIRKKEFWICNKDTCDLLNNVILNKKNDNFLSTYFNKANNKFPKFYLDKIDILNLKIFCEYNKYENLIFVKKRENKDIWHLPLFFLGDVVDWLCIFIDEKNNFSKIVNKLFKKIRIKNEEIINRLKDFLFHKIIIQFEKDNE